MPASLTSTRAILEQDDVQCILLASLVVCLKRSKRFRPRKPPTPVLRNTHFMKYHNRSLLRPAGTLASLAEISLVHPYDTYGNPQFFKLFRMRHETAKKMFDYVRNSRHFKLKRHSLDPRVAMLAVIRRLATISNLSDIATTFSLSSTSLVRWTTRFMHAIAEELSHLIR